MQGIHGGGVVTGITGGQGQFPLFFEFRGNQGYDPNYQTLHDNQWNVTGADNLAFIGKLVL